MLSKNSSVINRILNFQVFDEQKDTFSGSHFLKLAIAITGLVGYATLAAGYAAGLLGFNCIPEFKISLIFLSCFAGFAWHSGLRGRAKNILFQIGISILGVIFMLFFMKKL